MKPVRSNYDEDPDEVLDLPRQKMDDLRRVVQEYSNV